MSNHCTIGRYTRGWAVGTGLPVSLEPREYTITGLHDVNGTVYYVLNDAYRVAATSLEGRDMCFVRIEDLFDAVEEDEEYEPTDAILVEIERELDLSAKMESVPALVL